MNAYQKSLLHSIISSRRDLPFEPYDEMRETCCYEKLMAVQAALLLSNAPKEFSLGMNRLDGFFWETRSWPLNCRPDDLYEYYLFGGGNGDMPSFKDALASDDLFTIHYGEFEGIGLQCPDGGIERLDLKEFVDRFCSEFPSITENEAVSLFFNDSETEISSFSSLMVRDSIFYWLDSGGYARYALTTLTSREIYKFLKGPQSGAKSMEERIAEVLIRHITPFSGKNRLLLLRTLRDETEEFVIHIFTGYSDYLGGGGCGLCNISPSFLFERALLKELLLNGDL